METCEKCIYNENKQCHYNPPQVINRDSKLLTVYPEIVWYKPIPAGIKIIDNVYYELIYNKGCSFYEERD
jgi:hypothetical protein